MVSSEAAGRAWMLRLLDIAPRSESGAEMTDV